MRIKYGKGLVLTLCMLLCLTAISPRAHAAETERVINLSLERVTAITDASVSYRLTGKYTGTIELQPAKDELLRITLDGLELSGSLQLADGANVELFLEGENIITGRTGEAAISKMTTEGRLTIDGTGSLTATGGDNSAGIGVSGKLLPPASSNPGLIYAGTLATGNIVINGGTIVAKGGLFGAGIGGGRESGLDGLTINGGVITASSLGGAGIGGGAAYYSDRRLTSYRGHGCRNVTINGGVITATGSDESAGLGGGYCYGTKESEYFTPAAVA